jgi:hypothetical protein
MIVVVKNKVSRELMEEALAAVGAFLFCLPLASLRRPQRYTFDFGSTVSKAMPNLSGYH